MFDEFGRPDWDSYFISLSFVISQRSLDQSTKHGCVIVDNEKSILSVGYNSPPRGCDDALIPQTRPLKYIFFEHAESNAILNAARNGISVKNSTFYITGKPCNDCIRKIINVGAKKIIYGYVKSACVDQNDENFSILLNNQNIEVIEYQGDALKILENSYNYLKGNTH